MRRTLTVVFLTCSLALPVCAQRRGFSSPRGSGSVAVRSSHGTFGTRGAIAFRSGPAFRSGVGFRGGISFGHNPRFNVFLNSRPFHHPRRVFVYPYRYSYSYAYPYMVYPYYPLSYYDAYDYAAVPTQRSYAYDYASGEDNYPALVGLDQQMRQQGVGIYAPATATPAPPTEAAAPQPTATPQPSRQMPPTVLIYRDGKREEVSNYAIVGQTLWTFNERQARKISLSLLDLDATRKANEERGIEFAVPQP